MAPTPTHPTSQIELRQGRPVIVFGGRALSQAMYCDPAIANQGRKQGDPAWWLERNRDFFESGVHNFHIMPVRGTDGRGPERFWADDGAPSDGERHCLDAQAADTMAMDPDARLPAGMVREVARYGACHVWCEEDDDVLASETSGALHSVKPGPRVLKLPAERPAWDLLTGESLGVVDQIAMDITPPETRVFYFGADDPYR